MIGGHWPFEQVCAPSVSDCSWILNTYDIISMLFLFFIAKLTLWILLPFDVCTLTLDVHLITLCNPMVWLKGINHIYECIIITGIIIFGHMFYYIYSSKLFFFFLWCVYDSWSVFAVCSNGELWGICCGEWWQNPPSESPCSHLSSLSSYSVEFFV